MNINMEELGQFLLGISLGLNVYYGYRLLRIIKIQNAEIKILIKMCELINKAKIIDFKTKSEKMN